MEELQVDTVSTKYIHMHSDGVNWLNSLLEEDQDSCSWPLRILGDNTIDPTLFEVDNFSILTIVLRPFMSHVAISIRPLLVSADL